LRLTARPTSTTEPEEHAVTLEYDVRIDPCDRARSIRDLVMSEAAESERLRTMSPAVVEAMWASGLMVAFNPTTAGGSEP